MPKPLTALSIMWPGTRSAQEYLLGRTVDVVVFGKCEKNADKFIDLQTLRAKVAYVDDVTGRESLALELPDRTTLKLAQNRGRYWGKSKGKASERGYYDIRMKRATAPEESLVGVLDELSSNEHLAQTIALINEEVDNAFGEIVLRSHDVPTLTKALRATKYLSALIELLLELAKETRPLLKGEVDALIERHLTSFADLVHDPRIMLPPERKKLEG